MRDAGSVRAWIVQHREKGYLAALVAETPEDIEARYPELRVVEPPPRELDQKVLTRLVETAQPLDDNWLDFYITQDRNRPAPLGPVRGTVKWFNARKGVGAISTEETKPWDVWVHNSHIDGPGYRTLTAGEEVTLTYEAANQDSFRFRAIKVTR